MHEKFCAVCLIIPATYFYSNCIENQSIECMQGQKVSFYELNTTDNISFSNLQVTK